MSDKQYAQHVIDRQMFHGVRKRNAIEFVKVTCAGLRGARDEGLRQLHKRSVLWKGYPDEDHE